MWTILLLLCSNAFMTLAWYGHLKFKTYPLVAVILASWLIALPEYLFQVPANRIGHGYFSAPQLKIIQEVISITAFVVFNAFYLKDHIRGTDWVAFGLIIVAVVVMMAPRLSESGRRPTHGTMQPASTHPPSVSGGSVVSSGAAVVSTR